MSVSLCCRNRVDKKLCNSRMHLLSSSFAPYQITTDFYNAPRYSAIDVPNFALGSERSDEWRWVAKNGSSGPRRYSARDHRGPRCIPRIPRDLSAARSLALLSRRPSFRMHTGCATSVHSRGMHARVSRILIFGPLSRRQISNADTLRDIGNKRRWTRFYAIHLPRVFVIS